jgi:hypothetical protein
MRISPFSRLHLSLRIVSLLSCLISAAALTAHAQSVDPRGLDLVCPLVEYERQRVLEDAQFELELVENEYRARNKVFEMVEKLWIARAIEQEVYLEYKRLRDRTKVRIARVTIEVAQQRSTVEQYGLACARVLSHSIDQLKMAIDEMQAEYRRLDCELLARDTEIASIDHQFDKAMLEATRTLTESNIKSKYDLVIDEYDLSQSKAKVESYSARTKVCRKRLAD